MVLGRYREAWAAGEARRAGAPLLDEAGGLPHRTCVLHQTLLRAQSSGTGRDFETVITGDMVEHSKPLPDIYLLACEKLGTDPAGTYAIEDSPNGIRSAHAAGMHPLMVPDMIAPDEEMETLSEQILDSLFDVLTYLKQAEGVETDG